MLCLTRARRALKDDISTSLKKRCDLATLDARQKVMEPSITYCFRSRLRTREG